MNITKKILSSIFVAIALTANAAWEIISTSGNYFEVSDGTWTIKCEKLTIMVVLDC